MSGIFSIDGAFYKYGSIVADIMLLTVFWLLLCIPIVTAGAATTAVFYVTTKRVNNKDTYIWRDFWKSFRINFKSATIIWIGMLLVFGIAAINLFNVGVFGSASSIFLALEVLLILETLMVGIYIFPMLSRFEMGKVQLVKSAFLMANRHLLTSLSCVALIGGCLWLIGQWYILLFLSMGTYAHLSSMMLMRVFKKYRPDIDQEVAYNDIQESKNAIRALDGSVDNTVAETVTETVTNTDEDFDTTNAR